MFSFCYVYSNPMTLNTWTRVLIPNVTLPCLFWLSHVRTQCRFPGMIIALITHNMTYFKRLSYHGYLAVYQVTGAMAWLLNFHCYITMYISFLLLNVVNIQSGIFVCIAECSSSELKHTYGKWLGNLTNTFIISCKIYLTTTVLLCTSKELSHS